MKKFFAFIIAVCCLVCILPACKSQSMLIDRVSQLRLDIFSGKSEHFLVKAWYGFTETPFDNDGNVKERVYQLTFSMPNLDVSNSTYTVNMEHNKKTYSQTFSVNPVTSAVNAVLNVSDFNLKEFIVTIKCDSFSQDVTLKSILPDNTLSYQNALSCLEKNQKTLIDSYYDQNGNFTAEIHLRVLLKDDKPYYYVGLASANGNLKAFLLDGITGEVLAIREIF